MNPIAKNSGVRRSTSKPLSKEEKKRGSSNKMNKIELFSPKTTKREKNNASNISEIIQHSKSSQPSTKASTRNE